MKLGYQKVSLLRGNSKESKTSSGESLLSSTLGPGGPEGEHGCTSSPLALCDKGLMRPPGFLSPGGCYGGVGSVNSPSKLLGTWPSGYRKCPPLFPLCLIPAGLVHLAHLKPCPHWTVTPLAPTPGPPLCFCLWVGLLQVPRCSAVLTVHPCCSSCQSPLPCAG